MDKLEQKRKGDTGVGDGSVSIKKQKTSDQEEQSGDLLDSGTVGKHDLKNLDQGNRAEQRNEECPVDDWTTYRYKSLPPTRNRYGGRAPIYYVHWLTQDYPALGKEEDYDEFDTLIHATSISNTKKIFEHGGLKQQVVEDSSIINPGITFYSYDNSNSEVSFNHPHPMLRTELVWYGPYKRDNLRASEPKLERYGNAVFSMKTLYGFEGIIRESGDFNFYFVEIIDFLNESACRILVTKKEYPELLKYDPFEKGGPWYIDENGKHFYLKKVNNASGRYVPNTLEFMREEEESFRSMWLTNHDISYEPCKEKKIRRGVSISKNDSYDRDRLKLAMGLLAYRMECKNNFVLQQWCFLNGEKDILDILKGEIGELTVEDEEGIHAMVEYDGPDAVEFNWLKNQQSCYQKILYKWLKTKLDMKVFDITQFIRFILIFHKDEFFKVNDIIQWDERFFDSLYPPHRPFFLEKLEGIIQEELFHTCNGLDIDMSVGQSHFRTFNIKSKKSIKNGEFIHYWLPDDSKTLANEEEYEDFDTLTHTTSLTNVYEIFERGRLASSGMADNSVVSEDCYGELGQQRHPLAEVKLISYHPGSRDKMKRGTFSDHHNGNVIFAMKKLDDHGGIVDRKDGKNFHYYFVEVVEHEDACICRILVTKRMYPQLRSYDPNRKGGPWYVANGKHLLLKKIQNLQGERVSNTVEFYREELNNETLETSWLINHEILYKGATNGGNRDKDEGNMDKVGRNLDKDEVNRDKYGGYRDKDEGNTDKDGRNKDKDEGNRGNYGGYRDKDEGNREEDEGNRDKDEGNTDKKGRIGDGELRLALGLLACKIAQPDNLVLLQWFLLVGINDIYEVLRDIHRNLLGEFSECGEDTDGPCPDQLSKHIAQLVKKCHFEQNGEELFRLYGELSKEIDFRNMDMASFVQGILKFYQKQFFIEEVELQTIYKKLLSLVNPDRLSVFLEELEQALQEHALHRIHRKVLIRTKRNWTGFSYYIRHPGASKNKGGDYVRHWLPKDYKDLLPEDSNASNRELYHKRFDVLMKSPDEKNYKRNCDGTFEPVLHGIDNPSVANKETELYNDSFKRIMTHYTHPLSGAKIYRYMADTFENVKHESERKKKYGENTFRMRSLWGSEGIYMQENNFNYYLIEVIDFRDESICRILATYGNEYPGLLKIDTENVGGPFYIERKPRGQSDLLNLGMIKNFEGRKVNNRVEFCRRVSLNRWAFSDWEKNHHALFQ